MVVRWVLFTIVVVYCGKGEEMELRNCRTNCNPDTTLYEEEVNVILTVVRDVLHKIQRPETTGSLLLIGQEDGKGEIESIAEFDFEGGAVEKRYTEKSSSWVVRHIAEAMAGIAIDEKGVIICYPEPGFDEEVLILKTSLGRFICAACIGEYPYCEVEIFLAVAKALAEMRKEDAVLQEAYLELLREEACCAPGLHLIDDYIASLFGTQRRTSTSKLKTWKEWYMANEPKAYFE